ncbi:MAG: sporulation peptidase YabG [Bacilli bacterium]|nr:sporulation peptidase YabG [Bacilli bacterium]
MSFNIGDYVTRNSYNNDTVFKIIDIDNDIAYLKGVNIRLEADSNISDLKKIEESEIESDDKSFLDRFDINLNRDEYFYLPGKVVHIDGDEEYLSRCMDFYNKVHVKAYGINLKEDLISDKIQELLDEYNPDILVITGHDAYYKKLGNESDNNNYKNTKNFINSVKTARKLKSHDKLIIIAGACQSNYEELIKAGANFASSPKRINIHALDPAIVASSVALSDKNKPIDLIGILEKTKYGARGIGGIITNGCMYVGYPR